MPRVLLLGGTTEASALARAFASAGTDAVFSYAGRTAKPVSQPVPTRVGGFGGVDGLTAYLQDNAITHVVDATHPFAARMSTNAVAACARQNVPLAALERAPWQAGDGDNWTFVPNITSAVKALPATPARVFLAIGKQNIGDFADAPWHHYLLRLVDRPDAALPLPDTSVVLARGPFDAAGDQRLLEEHRIDLIVAKNAGGAGAEAKLIAARNLNLPVILIDRPKVPPRTVLRSVDQAMRWLVHPADLGV